MASGRHSVRARRQSSSPRRRKGRHRSRRAARIGTPMLGATMVVGAAMASVNASPGAEPSADTTGDLPVIRHKRDDAADDVSRGPAAKATSEPRAKQQPAAGRDSGAESKPKPKPKPGPTKARESGKTEPKAKSNSGAVSRGVRIVPIPGCDAEVPAEGSVANGEFGEEFLCDLGNGHKLRPDAAAAFVALAGEYRDRAGGSLLDCVTDSYRSYDLQVDLKLRKPYLAAKPGTSNHGWGVAVDLGCGAEEFDEPLHEWLEDNGDEYGWTNPDWAQPSGSKPEPWHWEFDPSLVE